MPQLAHCGNILSGICYKWKRLLIEEKYLKNSNVRYDTLELIIYNLTFVISKYCILLKYDTSMRLGEENVKYINDYVACSEAF